MKLVNSDVDALTNTTYFVGYSQGCYAGSFDNRSEGHDDYLTADCICEHLTCGAHGAAAFVANSRYGWGVAESTDGPSQHFDREFWDAILGEGIPWLGLANDDSKWDQAGYISMDPFGRWACYELNLFGDPHFMIKLGVSSDGIAALDRSTYAAEATAEVIVLDLDLDTNPSLPDTTSVEVASSTEASAESVTCTESGNSSGVFMGSIALAPGTPAGDGVLQVAHGDTITATYVDADDGAGGTNVPCVATAVVDALGPSFAGLASASPGSGYVNLSWSPAGDDTPPVRYRIYRASAPGAQNFDAPIATTHDTSFCDETAQNWQTYYYVVRAEDAVGNREANTVEKSATPRQLVAEYSWNLDTDPGWTREGDWEFGRPRGGGWYCSDPTTGHTGMNVYGYNLTGDYFDNIDPGDCLITTPLDCSEMLSVTLRFWRWLGVEYAIFDEAAVEISTDGTSWTPVWEHTGETICDTAWTECTYDITNVAAGQPTVYLRWRMGPTDDIVTYPGWNIDDIEILAISAVGASGRVFLDADLYAPGNEPLVAVCDRDLDTSPTAPDTVTVDLTSDTEAAAEALTLTETGSDTCVFIGSLSLATGTPTADGVLQISDGDTITAAYTDEDDGLGGHDVLRTTTASVDARAPSFSGLGAACPGDGYVSLTWQSATDRTTPIAYSIYRSTEAGAQNFDSPLLVTNRTSYRDADVVNGETYYYIARAQDAVGNADENALQRMATPGPLELIHSFPLNTDPGWTRQGDWQFGQPTGQGSECGDPTSGHTGPNVFGFNLAGDYYDSMRAFQLISSPINCSDLLSVNLRFWRWLGVEDAMWDQASLSASNDGVHWDDVWTHSGYSICDGSWVQCSYDISPIAARRGSVWLTWTMGPSDYCVTYPGWNIDDIEIWGIRAEVIFPDVIPTFWAFCEIQACSRSGIVAGYEDGKYHPERQVTRDQMAVYIARALAGGENGVPDPAGDPSFSDVAADHWAYRHIEFVADENVVQGYEDGTYRPGTPVTRDQMAVYIARSVVEPHGEAGLADYVPPTPPSFSDVAEAFWAYTHIEYCVQKGIVRGYEDGTYHPEYPVTRDQMAVYVARAFSLPI